MEPKIVSEGEKLFAKVFEAAETESRKYQLERAKLMVDYIKSYYLSVKYNVAVEVKELLAINYTHVQDT